VVILFVSSLLPSYELKFHLIFRELELKSQKYPSKTFLRLRVDNNLVASPRPKYFLQQAMTHRNKLRTDLNFNKIDELFDFSLDDRRIVALDRKLEEQSDYFRRQAGWYDDDNSMRTYNRNVHNDFNDDDENVVGDKGVDALNVLKTSAKIFSALVGVVFLIKAVSRSIIRLRNGGIPRDKRGRRRRHSLSNRSMSHSKSMSSKHITELAVESAHENDYEIMEDTINHSSRTRTRSRARTEKMLV